MTPIILTVIIIVAAASPIRAILEVVFGLYLMMVVMFFQSSMMVKFTWSIKLYKKKAEAEAPFVLM
jgi:hypothetical protein